MQLTGFTKCVKINMKCLSPLLQNLSNPECSKSIIKTHFEYINGVKDYCALLEHPIPYLFHFSFLFFLYLLLNLLWLQTCLWYSTFLKTYLLMSIFFTVLHSELGTPQLLFLQFKTPVTLFGIMPVNFMVPRTFMLLTMLITFATLPLN